MCIFYHVHSPLFVINLCYTFICCFISLHIIMLLYYILYPSYVIFIHIFQCILSVLYIIFTLLCLYIFHYFAGLYNRKYTYICIYNTGSVSIISVVLLLYTCIFSIICFHVSFIRFHFHFIVHVVHFPIYFHCSRLYYIKKATF